VTLGILTAAEHDQIESQLREGLAADGSQLGADTLLGRFEFLADQTGVTIAFALCPHVVLVSAWLHTGGLHHALPRNGETGMSVIVA
jgi:hypothetical protein